MGGWLLHSRLNDMFYVLVCNIKSGKAILVFSTQVSARIDEDLSNFCMTQPSRKVQWGKAILVCGMKVSARIDEILHCY